MEYKKTEFLINFNAAFVKCSLMNLLCAKIVKLQLHAHTALILGGNQMVDNLNVHYVIIKSLPLKK